MVTRLRTNKPLGALLVLGSLLLTGTTAQADVPPSILQAVMRDKDALADDNVQQAQCSSCGNGLFGPSTVGAAGCGGCGAGGCSAGCFPGQLCQPCEGEGFFGRTFARLHNCVCCPDPCYEPRWIAAANAAFFQDAARPVTQTRIRWDHGMDVKFPDRNNYLFPSTTDARRLRSVDYDELKMSIEAGTDAFSVTVDTPYRYWTTDQASDAGFGDIAIATKSLLLDCELIQMAFQFRTTIPSASAGQWLGLGLVSLEPSLLFSVKLYEDTYFQSQIAEWIPLGGSETAGSLFRYNFAFNRVLWRAACCQDMLLVGTFEVNCITFQAGKFHAVNDLGAVELRNSSGSTYVNLGPGLRYQLCDRMDIGFAASFAVSKDHYADQLYRTEFRWRF